MLEAVKFPARIADLDTGLTDVDRDALSHFRRKKSPKKRTRRRERKSERAQQWRKREKDRERNNGVYQDACALLDMCFLLCLGFFISSEVVGYLTAVS